MINVCELVDFSLHRRVGETKNQISVHGSNALVNVTSQVGWMCHPGESDRHFYTTGSLTWPYSVMLTLGNSGIGFYDKSGHGP